MASLELSVDDMYKLSTSVYNTYFKNCQCYRDDLISEGVYAIMLYKDKISDKYEIVTTYIYKCIYYRMLMFYRKQKKHTDNCVSYDKFDFDISEFDDIDKLNTETDIKEIKTVKTNSDKKDKIINMLLNCETQKNVAKKMRVSAQYVNTVWKEYCEKINKMYKYSNGELVKKVDNGDCNKRLYSRLKR